MEGMPVRAVNRNKAVVQQNLWSCMQGWRNCWFVWSLPPIHV